MILQTNNKRNQKTMRAHAFSLLTTVLQKAIFRDNNNRKQPIMVRLRSLHRTTF